MALDAKYETGVVWQDFQHKQLIDLFEKIKAAKANQNDKNLYRYTLAFLAMYVNHHFALEKEYMDKYDYSERDFHLEEHRLYILRLKDFRDKHREYSHDAALKLIEEMTNWVYSHIMENDKKLGQFILEKEHGWHLK